jgi:hypothetical protein
MVPGTGESHAVGFRIRGDVSCDSIQPLLAQLVKLHPALSMKYTQSSLDPRHRQVAIRDVLRGNPWAGADLFLRQAVEALTPVLEVDLSGQADAEGELNILCEKYRSAPILLGDPSFRSLLIKLRGQEHILILLLDPLVCDLQSIAALSEDVRVLATGRSVSSALRRSALDDAFNLDFDASVRYWRHQWVEYASSRATTNDFPFALSPPSPTDHSHFVESLDLDDGLQDAVRSLARRLRATAHSLVVSIFTTLLFAYSGRRRLSFWNFYANRGPSSFYAVDHLSNAHLLGLDYDPQMTGIEAVEMTASRIREGGRFQGMPLEYLWSTLRVRPRFPGLNLSCGYVRFRVEPPVQMVNDKATIEVFELPDLISRRSLRFSVYLIDRNQQMSLKIRFPAVLFEKEGIRQVLADLALTTRAFTQRPFEPISSLIPRPAEERGPARAMAEFILYSPGLLPVVTDSRSPEDR